MTDRQHLTYTGDDPVILPGSVAPRPELVTKGTVVEVDGESVELLLARGDFITTPEEHQPDPGAALDIAEPRPLDIRRAEESLAATDSGRALADRVAGFIDPDRLAGDALDAALREANLTHTGTVADKRDRLADWQDEQRQALARATAAAGTTPAAVQAAAPLATPSTDSTPAPTGASTTTEEARRG